MSNISKEQIRQYRLYAHHLDKLYQKTDMEDVVGACGFQNSPPGAWEIALHNRIPYYKQVEMKHIPEVEKTLLQSWSFRGAPVVFPTSESHVFLSALISKQDEPWIYTRGIHLALDFLEMSFEEVLILLKQVIPKLDNKVLKSKTLLDQTLAEWILPLLPNCKKDLWNNPSMYGSPSKQTVGGAAVSFLLRPCAFMGLVVFAKREGISPTFTSYKHWVGHSIENKGMPEQQLIRKYLHCYAPASVSEFADWLGCSSAQAQRMWQTVIDEIEPVVLSGKEYYILSDDKKLFFSPPQSERKLHLLGGHDPYLGLQDRNIILEDRTKQRQIWQTVSNPGAVLWHGEIVGTWKSKKKGKMLDVEVTLWNDVKISIGEIENLVHEYALFQNLGINKIMFFT